MAFNSPPNPDLASILRTLAAYTPVPASRPLCSNDYQAPLSRDNRPTLDGSEELEEGEYDPHQPLISNNPSQYPQTATQVRPITPPAKPPATDPTTITTYPAALRYITKTIVRNEQIMARIRKLIDVQHQHEQQWWEGREALLKKQSGREEARRKVGEVL